MRRKKPIYKNVRRLKGSYAASGKKFGIVVSEFNEFLTHRLLEGALDMLIRHGAAEKNIQVVYVPGAFEIPLAVQKLANGKKFDALMTLAVVIKGKTRHFDQVTAECAKGVQEVILKTQVPIILGMISAESIQDAIERVGLKQTNKAREWAISAIEMANVTQSLEKMKSQ